MARYRATVADSSARAYACYDLSWRTGYRGRCHRPAALGHTGSRAETERLSLVLDAPRRTMPVQSQEPSLLAWRALTRPEIQRARVLPALCPSLRCTHAVHEASCAVMSQGQPGPSCAVHLLSTPGCRREGPPTLRCGCGLGRCCPLHRTRDTHTAVPRPRYVRGAQS